MKNNFINYTEALALKELGFNEKCLGYYICKNSAFGVDDLLITTDYIDLLQFDSSSCKVPTYSQAFKFFRDKGLVGELFSQLRPSNNLTWGFKISNIEGIVDGFNTYGEAELECLQKLIKIAKENIN